MTFVFISIVLCGFSVAALGFSAYFWRGIARTRTQLRYAEQSYRALFDASPDMIFMLDTTGMVKLANRTAGERLFAGVGHSEGLCLFSFLDHEGKTRLQQLLAMAANKTRQDDLYFFPKLGEALHIDVNAFPSWDATGHAVVCCIARDLTDRLKMESQLVDAERLVVIGKMAAGIAHEVNNPLHIILTNAELMQEITQNAKDETCEELAPCIKAIIHNTDRAAGIIRQLLGLATPAPLTLALLNISALVQECLAFLRPRLKNIEVDISALPPALPLFGDKAQLEQLLLNLFLNALASMNDVGRLRVSGQQNNVEKDSIRLEIQDNGKGIAKENLEKIFDLFFTTRNREGFGLGLFLCRRIAERHSGILFAESGPGRGATFILELPIGKKHLL